MAEIGKNLERAKEILISGGLVGIPTETVYGLAANALDPAAVARIFSAKNRPSFDPLIVHTHSLATAKELVTSWPPFADQLARQCWPGPLTLLLPRASIIPDLVTSGMPDVAIRVPDSALTLTLLRTLDFPLVAPSANPFGYISPTTPAHVNEQLGDQVEYILDGGPCKVGVESTIVGVEKEHPHIYRKGGLPVEKIEAIAGKVIIQPNSSSNPRAPGMLNSHYAPRKKMVLGKIDELINEYDPDHCGILAFDTERKGLPKDRQRILAPDGQLVTAAKNLFGYLRELDAMEIDIILAEEVPDHLLGLAINDRLRRAAAE